MDLYTVAAVAGTGLGVGAAVRAAALPPPAADLPPLERRRRESLRRQSAVYRQAEQPVQALAAVLARTFPKTVAQVGTALAALADDDWKAEEALAVKLLVVAPGVAAMGLAAALAAGPAAGLAVGVGLLAAAPLLVVRGFKSRAAARVGAIRRRLPYTLDLMALVLEAGGGTLFDCLRLGAAENPGHPLGEELGRVVGGADRGTAPVELLADMGRRLNDPDIAEVTLTVATAETRGMPLKECLRAVAVRLRTKAVQWQEKACEEAKVHITWPAMVVMLACLLVIVAPIAVAALNR